MELNKYQESAVLDESNTCLVRANVGSGKTTVLIEKIKYLYEQKKIPLEDMIADVRQDTRPNLAGDKAERMRTLYGRRERLYAAAAHLSFDNRMPPEEAAKAIQKLLTE